MERRSSRRPRPRPRHALQLGLVDEGNHWRTSPHRHTSFGQRADGAQAPLRRAARGSRMRASAASSVVIDSIHRDQLLRGHRCDQIEITLHAGDGDQRERMLALGQHLDHRARDAQSALDRLVVASVAEPG